MLESKFTLNIRVFATQPLDYFLSTHIPEYRMVFPNTLTPSPRLICFWLGCPFPVPLKNYLVFVFCLQVPLFEFHIYFPLILILSQMKGFKTRRDSCLFC